MTTSGTPGHSPDSHRTLVTFRLDRQVYGFPIEPVVQIIEMVTITPIPQAGSYLEGVINVRGDAVPVINLRCHLGLPRLALQLHTPIILTRTGRRMVGLVVDEVTDVCDIAIEQVIRAADVLPPGMAELPFLRGLIHAENRTVLLLDHERLLDGRPLPGAAEVLRALPDMPVPASAEPAGAPTAAFDEFNPAPIEFVHAAAAPAAEPAEPAAGPVFEEFNPAPIELIHAAAAPVPAPAEPVPAPEEVAPGPVASVPALEEVAPEPAVPALPPEETAPAPAEPAPVAAEPAPAPEEPGLEADA